MTELVDITQRLAIWADELRAIAQTGLAFKPQVYDRERYEELLRLAAEMATAANGRAALDPTLAARLTQHWRDEIHRGVPGYVTPKVGVGAAVFNQRDEILLIQRPDSGLWLYPTGWLDVGDSPAETAVKEVAEETGLIVEADRLLGVFDSNLRHYPMHFHMVSVMVYCRLVGGELRPSPTETLAAGFFPRQGLPEPLCLRGDWVEELFAFHHGRRGPVLE